MTTKEEILHQSATDRGELYVQLDSEVKHLRRINEKLAEENSRLTEMVAQLTEDMRRKSLNSTFMGRHALPHNYALPLQTTC